MVTNSVTTLCLMRPQHQPFNNNSDSGSVVLGAVKRIMVNGPQRPISHSSDFWESEEILLVEFLWSGATISSERYVQTLKRSKQGILRVRPNREVDQFRLHNNATPHTSLNTREAIVTMKWTVLPYPPYSPE